MYKAKLIVYLFLFRIIFYTFMTVAGYRYVEIENIQLSKPTEIKQTDLKSCSIEEEIENNLISIGEFKLTAYCSCRICCGRWASNRPVDEHGNEIVYGSICEVLEENYSIAVDPDIIPYGTEVIINEHTYKAQDCGGGIDGNEIDVYFADHQAALEFGIQYAEVYKKEEEN